MKYIFLVFIVLIFGCSPSKSLIHRGLTEEERGFFVVQNGWGLTQEEKDHFKKGLPCLGMKNDMIFSMYGSPDFVQKVKEDPDTGQLIEYKWSYFDVEKNTGWAFELVAEFIFNENGIVTEIIGEPCKTNGSCEK